MLKTALLAAGLVLCFKEHPVTPKKTDNLTILLIGDSFGVGLGTEFKKLAKENGHKPIVLAKEGSLTHDWVKDSKKYLGLYKPDLVIVSLGTNDGATSADWLKRHEGDYQEIVDNVIDSGSEIEWVMPPTIDDKRLKNLDIVEKKISDAVGDDLFDSRELDIPRAPDKIHSTQKGYSDWMDRIWENLKREKKL